MEWLCRGEKRRKSTGLPFIGRGKVGSARGSSESFPGYQWQWRGGRARAEKEERGARLEQGRGREREVGAKQGEGGGVLGLTGHVMRAGVGAGAGGRRWEGEGGNDRLGWAARRRKGKGGPVRGLKF
jgi:hypothetical protein